MEIQPDFPISVNPKTQRPDRERAVTVKRLPVSNTAVTGFLNDGLAQITNLCKTVMVWEYAARAGEIDPIKNTPAMITASRHLPNRYRRILFVAFVTLGVNITC